MPSRQEALPIAEEHAPESVTYANPEPLWQGPEESLQERFAALTAERLIPLQREVTEARYRAQEAAADSKRKGSDLEAAEQTFLVSRSAEHHDALEAARHALKRAIDAAEIASRAVDKAEVAVEKQRRELAAEVLNAGLASLDRNTFSSKVVATMLNHAKAIRAQLRNHVLEVEEEVRKRSAARAFAHHLASIAGVNVDDGDVGRRLRGFDVDDVRGEVRRMLTEEARGNQADQDLESWISTW
jgi:hypothetical protein